MLGQLGIVCEVQRRPQMMLQQAVYRVDLRSRGCPFPFLVIATKLDAPAVKTLQEEKQPGQR